MPITLESGTKPRSDTGRTRKDNIPRNHNDWPILPNPQDPNQKPTPCHRPSGFAKKHVTDSYAVDQWEKRTILIGAGNAPHLANRAATLDIREDAKELNDLVTEAANAGGRSAKADYGTALHTLLEKHLLGQPVNVPPTLADDFQAIVQCVAEHRLSLHEGHAETFVINMSVPAGGSYDALVTGPGLPQPTILDLKTGHNIFKYSGPLECAVQLAIYAGATHSWKGEGNTPQPLPDTNQDFALILHAPLGTGTATIEKIDLAEGRKTLEIGMAVRDARRNVKRFRLGPLEREVCPKVEEPAKPVTYGEYRNVRSPDFGDLCEELAVRARRIVDNTDLTREDLRQQWPPAPSLNRPAEHTKQTLRAIHNVLSELEGQTGSYPALTSEIETVMAVLAELPQDLYDRVNAKAKTLTPPVPNLETSSNINPVLVLHIDALWPLVEDAQTVHANRRAEVNENFEHLTDEQFAEFREVYGELELVATLTGLEAAKAIAVAQAVAYAKYPDLDTLVDLAGGKAKVRAKGRELAKLHDISMPSSAQAVAGDKILAALVWRALWLEAADTIGAET